MNCYVGIDVGHTKIKSGLFDRSGRLLCMSSKETPFVSNVVETEKLWICVAECIRNLIANSGVDATQIKAVACAGHGNGLYAIDKEGKALQHAYAATTQIGQKALARWKDSGIDREIYPYILQEMWVGQPLPILADLKSDYPQVYEEIDHIMFCKDFVNYCLTGHVFTDYTDASAAGILNTTQGTYSRQILKQLELEDVADMLPGLKKSTDVVGYVTNQAAVATGLKEGTIVAGGCFDVVASLLGTGICENDTCGMISGTWGINALVSQKLPKVQKFLQCTCFVDGQEFLFIESAPTSSVNLEWLLKRVFCNVTYEGANQIVEKFSAADVSALYLPYIYGDLRGGHNHGAFYGLTSENNWETMIRAVYEGVALGHRKQLQKLIDSDTGFERIVLVGGAAASKIWCQIFADVLNRDVYVPKNSNVGMLGTAMIAAVACGEYKDYKEACSTMKGNYNVYEPNLENVKYYNQKYKMFCEI